MPKHEPPPANHPAERQRAELAIAFGKRAGLSLSAELTSAGLLSIGALVAAVLLSTAVLVGVATRGKRGGQEAS